VFTILFFLQPYLAVYPELVEGLFIKSNPVNIRNAPVRDVVLVQNIPIFGIFFVY
jgi:hypothetical protein